MEPRFGSPLFPFRSNYQRQHDKAARSVPLWNIRRLSIPPLLCQASLANMRGTEHIVTSRACYFAALLPLSLFRSPPGPIRTKAGKWDEPIRTGFVRPSFEFLTRARRVLPKSF